MSLRDRILAAACKFQPTAVEVPELGGTVYVRPLSIAGMARFHASLEKDPASAALIMLTDCLCDADGSHLFTAADQEAIGNLSSEVGQRLIEIINKISGLAKKATVVAAGE